MNEDGRKLSPTKPRYDFQDSPLLEYLSVKDNIYFRLQLSAKKHLGHFENSLSCGIRRITRYPAQLSEGEKQRAAMCQTLISFTKTYPLPMNYQWP